MPTKVIDPLFQPHRGLWHGSFLYTDKTSRSFSSYATQRARRNHSDTFNRICPTDAPLAVTSRFPNEEAGGVRRGGALLRRGQRPSRARKAATQGMTPKRKKRYEESLVKWLKALRGWFARFFLFLREDV